VSPQEKKKSKKIYEDKLSRTLQRSPKGIGGFIKIVVSPQAENDC